MEIEQAKAREISAFIITAVFLAAMAVAMVIMFGIARDGVENMEALVAAQKTAQASAPASAPAATAPEMTSAPALTSAPAAGPTTSAAAPAVKGDPKRAAKMLAKLAGLSLVMLCITLVMLFWLVARFLLHRFRGTSHSQKTEYVDAWSLAGKRMKAPPEEEEEED